MKSRDRARVILKGKSRKVINVPRDSVSRLYNSDQDFRQVCDYLNSKCGIADNYFRKNRKKKNLEAIASIFVAGGKTQNYSDLDVMIVFKDNYLDDTVKDILRKKLLAGDIVKTDRVKLYLCNESEYHNPKKPKLADKDLSDYLNENYKPGEALVKESEDWGNLARMYQLMWKVKTGRTQFGKKLIESLEDVDIEIPAEEGYELYIIQTRKFLEGFFNRKKHKGESAGEYKDYLIKQDRKLAKAILRGVDSLHILLEQKALIDPGAINKKSEKLIFRHFRHDNFRKLVNAAYHVKSQGILFSEALDKTDSKELKQDILGFFNFLKNLSRSLIYEYDYIWNNERLKLLNEYYTSNTPDLLKLVDKIEHENKDEFRNKFPALNYYVDGVLTFIEKDTGRRLKSMSKRLLTKVSRAYKDMHGWEDIETRITRGIIALELEDYDDAIKSLESAIKSKKGRPIFGFSSVDEKLTAANIYKKLGAAYLNKKSLDAKRKKARKYLEKAVSLNPRDPMSWKLLAEATSVLDKKNRRKDYQIISGAVKDPQNMSLLTLKSFARDKVFNLWRKDISERIKTDMKDAKNKIDEYSNRKLEIFDNAAKELIDSVNERLEVADDGLKESYLFLSFQKNMLDKIKKVSGKNLFELEEFYFNKKRAFKSKVREIDTLDDKIVNGFAGVESDITCPSCTAIIPGAGESCPKCGVDLASIQKTGPWYDKQVLANKLTLSIKPELAALASSITAGEIALYAERLLDVPAEFLDGTRLLEGVVATSSILLLLSKLLSREYRLKIKTALEKKLRNETTLR